LSEALLKSLETCFESSEAAEYEKTGFHHRHRANLDKVVDIAQVFLEAGYILEMITCEDRREDAQAMRLCYTYNSFQAVDRHLIQVDVAGKGEKDPSYHAPTLCEIYGGANWFEREVFEMYGVVFEDHPYLERLLLPEDVDFFALRRDFGRIEDAEENAE
jgi:NADH-quinone oxidoreductase subunit C